MIGVVATAGMVLVGLSVLGLLYRLVRGPSGPDRVLAFDAISVNMIAFVALLAISLDTETYTDLFLVVAIISFIGSVALALFLSRGSVVPEARK